MTFPIRHRATLNHSLGPRELFHVYFVLRSEFLDDSNSRSICAKKVDGTFKGEDGTHWLERSSDTGEDWTVVDSASDDTCVEEGFLEGGFWEWWLFVGLNVFFVDEIELSSVPVDMVDHSINVVEKDVGVAVDAFKHVDIRVVVPVGELHS